jgi:predicted RNA-binding Zn-ribbon protein involved in translation (DUF1610 family)
MDIQAAYEMPSATKPSRPECPHCGSTIWMAEQSAFVPNGCIRHAWSCDDCGHAFVTSVRVLCGRS